MSQRTPPYRSLSRVEVLPRRIEEALQYRGRSQSQMARDLGLLPGTVSRLMQGKTAHPSVTVLRAIAQYLDVQSDYLLGLSDSMRRPRLRPGATAGETDRGHWRYEA